MDLVAKTNNYSKCASLSAIKEFGKKLPEVDRARYVKQMGEAKEPSLLEFVIPFLEDKDWRVRMEAVGALGKIQDKRSMVFLVEMMEKEEEFLVKRALVNALGLFCESSNIGLFVKVLDDESTGIRSEAVRALLKINRNELVPELCATAMESDSKNVKIGIVKVFGQFKPEFADEKVKSILRKFAKDENTRVEMEAKEALRALGNSGI